MLQRFKFLCVLASLLIFIKTNATHIVGGELNYRYLGNNLYEIRLTVYRDCYYGVPLFDDPASLGIFDQNNNLLTSINMSFLELDTLDINLNAPCFPVPPNICYEVTTYIDTIILPPSSSGYQLAYQRCCRGNSILNIASPDTTGSTFYATIPGSINNSNPAFLYYPPLYTCVNIPFTSNFSAIDIDNDSIVYELCYSMDGASLNNPQPQPPNPPPYQQLQLISPYNLGNVLSGSQPLTIDPVTGILTATPGTIGRFIYSICLKEYRNGLYLSTTRRDFEINVTPGFVGVLDMTEILEKFIIPNPAVSDVTIQFNSEAKNNYSLRFYDIHGRIVFEKNSVANYGLNEIKLNVEFLNKGIYLVEIVSEKNKMIKKLVVN